MLQELAARSGATAWAIASMLFFLAAWVAVVVWVVRRRPEEMNERARLPFDRDDPAGIREGNRIQESGVRIQEDSGAHDAPES